MTQEAFTSTKLRKKDLPRLEKFKVHPNQGYWEVIKKLIDEEEEKRSDKEVENGKQQNNI